MSLLYKLIRKQLFLVISAICTCGFSVIVTLWWNSQLAGIINIVSAGARLPAQPVLLALATISVMGVASCLNTYVSGYTSENMAHDLRMGYARHFSSISFADAENVSVGEQLSRLQNEIADISSYINSNLFQLLGDIIRFTITFVWLLFINPILTLATFLPVLPIMIYIALSSKVIQSATERSQQAKGRMNGLTETMLSLFPVIKLYDAQKMIYNRYDDDVAVWERETVRAERTRARLMSPSGLFSTSIPLILLFAVGGNMAIHGTIAIGTMYIFLNLSGNVTGVLMNMPGYIAAFRQFSANMGRIAPRILMEGEAP